MIDHTYKVERDQRGKLWLQTKVQEVLTSASVRLAPLGFEHPSALYWGHTPETGTTLFLRVEGHAEPQGLDFSQGLIADCGAGVRIRHKYATEFIRRNLRKMGIRPV